MRIKMPKMPARNPGAGMRRWPLLVIALSPAVAVWAGWVELGRMTGFGVVHPLPGIADRLQVDTSISLPIGVEAYAAYALAVLLSGMPLTRATRVFAGCSAAAALLLGMLGQVTYHLLRAAGYQSAPWEVTTVVACLPVAVLGAAAALWHMVHHSTRASTAASSASSGASAERPLSVQPFDAGEAVALMRPVTFAALDAPVSNGSRWWQGPDGAEAGGGSTRTPGPVSSASSPASDGTSRASIERSTFEPGKGMGGLADGAPETVERSIDAAVSNTAYATSSERRVTASECLVTIREQIVSGSGTGPTQLDRARTAYRLIAAETRRRPTGAQLAFILDVTESTARDYRQTVERELHATQRDQPHA